MCAMRASWAVSSTVGLPLWRLPNLTPVHARGNYKLYEGKPCTDEAREECKGCPFGRVKSIGREVAFNAWGDSPRYAKRQGETQF